MQDWYRRNSGPLCLLLAAAVSVVLLAACGGGSTSDPIEVEEVDRQMSETIERLQRVAPELQRQLDHMEKLHPELESNCASSYPEKCIPPPPPKLKCEDVGAKNFLVLAPDPHNFDPDGNGIGCEG